LPVMLLAGWFLLRRQRRKDGPGAPLVAFALALFAFLLTSRIFHHNYLAFLFLFLALPAFAERLSEEE